MGCGWTAPKHRLPPGHRHRSHQRRIARRPPFRHSLLERPARHAASVSPASAAVTITVPPCRPTALARRPPHHRRLRGQNLSELRHPRRHPRRPRLHRHRRNLRPLHGSLRPGRPANRSMGDTLHSPAGEHVLFHLKLHALDGAIPELIIDGNKQPFADQTSAEASGSEYTFDYASDGQRHWIRVNVRSTDGKLLLLAILSTSTSKPPLQQKADQEGSGPLPTYLAEIKPVIVAHEITASWETSNLPPRLRPG